MKKPSVSGTYLLLLHLPAGTSIQVGRTIKSERFFESGYYCYVGSALGPGGLASRLRRHASKPARKHWHIDYFSEQANLLGAFVVESRERLECRLAKQVGRLAAACIEGFGASDCGCKGHLFFLGEIGDESGFIKRVEEKLAARYCCRKELA